MKIWVDADACPAAVKEILFRAAERVGIELTLVANRLIRIPPSPYIRSIQVPSGFDVADGKIAELASMGDLVVTSDIPLAAQVIEKGGIALNPRGERYTRDNIGEALSLRNFMDGMRGSGVQTGGPPAFSHADRQAFARELDRLLSKPA